MSGGYRAPEVERGAGAHRCGGVSGDVAAGVAIGVVLLLGVALMALGVLL